MNVVLCSLVVVLAARGVDAAGNEVNPAGEVSVRTAEDLLLQLQNASGAGHGQQQLSFPHGLLSFGDARPWPAEVVAPRGK